MKILVTERRIYGSHTAVWKLLNAVTEVIVADNLSNSS